MVGGGGRVSKAVAGRGAQPNGPAGLEGHPAFLKWRPQRLTNHWHSFVWTTRRVRGPPRSPASLSSALPTIPHTPTAEHLAPQEIVLHFWFISDVVDLTLVYVAVRKPKRHRQQNEIMG